MNKTTGIIVGIIALVVIIGGVYASMNSKSEMVKNDEKMEQSVPVAMKAEDPKTVMENKVFEENDAQMKANSPKTDVMTQKDETTTTVMVKNDTMLKAGSYGAYSPEKVALASANQDVVLFFNANWCPTCRAADSDIKTNAGKIPSSLTILSVNYDNSTELKQKYGVTYQHTFVQVDKDGNLIKKWSGSPTLSQLVAQVK